MRNKVKLLKGWGKDGAGRGRERTENMGLQGLGEREFRKTEPLQYQMELNGHRQKWVINQSSLLP